MRTAGPDGRAISHALWLSVENLMKLSREGAALVDEIARQLGTLSCAANAKESDRESESDLNDWTCFREAIHYPLHPQKARRNARPFGTATIGIELWRDLRDEDSSWPHAREALLYVGFAPERNGWSLATLCLGADGKPVGGGGLTLAASTLWERADQAHGTETLWPRRSWFFCLPLGAISGPDVVASDVVGPLDRLLTRQSAEDAFRDATAVIRFEAVGG